MAASSGRLIRLRNLMKARNLDFYFDQIGDRHDSETVAKQDRRILYLSGFTGSTAQVVVTTQAALIWVDGRYHEQADKQLDDQWTVMKTGLVDIPTIGSWLSSQTSDAVSEPKAIGFDAFMVSRQLYKQIRTETNEKRLHMVEMNENLINLLWEETGDRPAPSRQPAFKMPEANAGESVQSKIGRLREKLSMDKFASACGAQPQQTAIVLSALDEIAWMLNLRGSDIPNVPVFFSYLLVTNNECCLFVDHCKLSESIVAGLKDAGVTLREYDDLVKFIQENKRTYSKIWLPETSCIGLYRLVESRCDMLQTSPVAEFKSVKNQAEQKGMRRAHVKDAVAVCEFLWKMSSAWAKYDELSAMAMLDDLRTEQDGYLSPSFDTISGYGKNGSIIHYSSTPETNLPISDDSFFLVDSGGHYIDGSTDITRTMHYGQPTKNQKRCFTRVLQGFLDLATATFPKSASAWRLDTLARKYLWEDQLDFKHGTGHGIGHCLNVHEGPFSISYRTIANFPLTVGATVTDEPGYYLPGKFGIRIENVLMCKQCSHSDEFLYFEHLTMVPIQRNLVDTSIMSKQQIDAFNSYHATVRQVMVDELTKQNKDAGLIEWLKQVTEPL